MLPGQPPQLPIPPAQSPQPPLPPPDLPPPPARVPRKAYAPQIELPDHELQRLANRIEEGFEAAQVDHTERMARFTRAYARWRNRAEPAEAGKEDKANFRVPMTQWQTYIKWAKELEAMFGDDAEIVAEPVGPSDHRSAEKVEAFVNWRVFNSMQFVSPMAVFSFRKILFGRAHALLEWDRRTFRVPMEDGGWEDQVCYDGQVFKPLWPDDLVVPGEDAETIQDFSWVIRKFDATPDDLLHGEDDGTYANISDNLDQILAWSEQRQRRTYDDPMKREADEAEGVVREGSMSAANTLRVWAWYGRWRRLKGRKSARPENAKGRERYESDLLVYYLPDLRLVVGCQDLAEMFPTSPDRRPIVEAALVHDGSYWSPGFFELLELVENELTVAHNLGSQAGQFSVGPIIFYDPASGFDPDSFVYEPFVSVPVKNPAGINIVQPKADLTYPITVGQQVQAIGERLTGLDDSNVGRSSDRPNAPRTARQFIGLLEQGNIRASLDTRMMREDTALILRRIWALEQMYGSARVFFRVTEEDAKGLFETSQGGAWMTSEERGGRYDFKLNFATSVWSREAQKERQMTLYQLDLQNPLVVQNPRALWKVTSQVHKALGDPNFADLVPEPPDMGGPKTPQEEWTLMQEGQDVTIRPEDHDDLHLLIHFKQLAQEQAGTDPDVGAIQMLKQHITDHQRQRQEKKLMGALASALTTQIAGAQRPGMPMQPGAAGAPGMDGLQQFLGQMSAAGQPPQNVAPPQQPAAETGETPNDEAGL